MARIMLIDDEENIVRALKRSLRSQGWEIVIHVDPHEALRDLEAGEYSVIISDYRMPAINGVEFLEYCRFRQPDAIRIVLSAYADKDAMLEAINTAQIYRFLTKPWDDTELQMVIREAIEKYDLIRETRRLSAIVKAQRNELDELARQHPELVDVKRDENDAILLEEGSDY